MPAPDNGSDPLRLHDEDPESRAGEARTPLRRALELGVAAGLILGFCFSIRAGFAIFAGVTLIVHFRLRPGLLSGIAGGLLAIVVPAVYLIWPGEDRGGYNPGYAGQHTGAHWIAVAAYTLLIVALIQSLSTARRRRGFPAAAAAGAGARRSRP
jgi:hypothetical protein